jgi:hypothetical protein
MSSQRLRFDTNHDSRRNRPIMSRARASSELTGNSGFQVFRGTRLFVQ